MAFTIKEKVTGQAEARLVGPMSEQKELAPSLGPVMQAAIEQGWKGYLYALEPTRVFAVA